MCQVNTVAYKVTFCFVLCSNTISTLTGIGHSKEETAQLKQT